MAIRGEYAGPIPPPAAFQEYEEVCPGAADRILAMAENESKHRHRHEMSMLSGTIWNERLGTAAAFVLLLAIVIVGAYVTLKGHPAVGGTIVGLPIIPIVTVFVKGRMFHRK